MSSHIGEYSFHAANLTFYVRTEATGVLRISIDPQGFDTHKAMPRPRMSSDSAHASVISWSFPSPGDVGAVHCFKRSSADGHQRSVPSGYTLEWLFASREALEKLLGVNECNA